MTGRWRRHITAMAGLPVSPRLTVTGVWGGDSVSAAAMAGLPASSRLTVTDVWGGNGAYNNHGKTLKSQQTKPLNSPIQLGQQTKPLNSPTQPETIGLYFHYVTEPTERPKTNSLAHFQDSPTGLSQFPLKGVTQRL
uniref:Uncharacterized protein n=1 Tax=Oryza glumipatula TaxID=40148 RepID=A0A0D9YN58_9ORYZ